MKPEQGFIRKQLEEELGELRFSRKAEVMERTHPRSWPARLKSLWNKEIELPLFPICIIFILLATIMTIAQLTDFHSKNEASQERRQLIEVGGNTYWKDDYEKAVDEREGDNKG